MSSFKEIGGNKWKMTSKPNYETMNHQARRNRLESNDRQQQLKTIYRRDHGICHLCGRHVKRKDASRDHIKNFALCTKEEARDIRNMRLAHKICNGLKETRTPAEWQAIRDSSKQPRLAQTIGSMFPSLSYMFSEANG